ncbi:hypothetical protein ACJX0J_030859, partial [Zea mays]
ITTYQEAKEKVEETWHAHFKLSIAHHIIINCIIFVVDSEFANFLKKWQTQIHFLHVLFTL